MLISCKKKMETIRPLGASMTTKLFYKVRLIFTIIFFIVLSSTLLPYVKELSFRSTNLFWFIILMLISFFILAIGISFLLDVFLLKLYFMKLFTGLLSLFLATLIILPQLKISDSLKGMGTLIGISFCSIAIPILFIIGITHDISVLRAYSIVLALISGIFCFHIIAFISRHSSNSEAGIAYLIYGLIMVIVSLIVNLIAGTTSKVKEK